MIPLKVKENLWQQSLLLQAENTFDRTKVVFLAIFIFVILEILLFWLLLKPFFPDPKNLIPFAVMLIGLPLLIFLMVAFSFMPRLLYLKLDNKVPFWELEILYLLFLRKKIRLSKEEVRSLYLSLNQGKRLNRLLMELNLTKGKPLKVIFAMEKTYNQEDLAKVFLNLAHLLKMKTYRAISHSGGFIINLDGDYRERVLLTPDSNSFLFERPESLGKEVIRLPNITIKEFTPWRVHFYKGISGYDILRYIALFIVVPSIFFIAYQSEDPQKYLAIGVGLAIYCAGLYFARHLLSPLEVILDKLRGVINIRKVFLKRVISLREVESLEVEDVSIRRGPLVFHIYLRLKDNKRVHLFFLETAKESVKIQETLSHLNLLLDYLREHFDFKVQFKLKHSGQ